MIEAVAGTLPAAVPTVPPASSATYGARAAMTAMSSWPVLLAFWYSPWLHCETGV